MWETEGDDPVITPVDPLLLPESPVVVPVVPLVDVPDEEYDTLGCNVLALAPRKVMMVAGNPVTQTRLEEAGCTVYEFDGSEICLPGAGGPTCLTRPLMRSSG